MCDDSDVAIKYWKWSSVSNYLSLPDRLLFIPPVLARVGALPARASSKLRERRGGLCREVELGLSLVFSLQSTVGSEQTRPGLRDQTGTRYIALPVTRIWSELLRTYFSSQQFYVLEMQRDAESSQLQNQRPLSRRQDISYWLGVRQTVVLEY